MIRLDFETQFSSHIPLGSHSSNCQATNSFFQKLSVFKKLRDSLSNRILIGQKYHQNVLI